MRQQLSTLYSKAKNNKEILFLFLASTIFYSAQKIIFWSWDFSVYLMNAQHFFSNGPFLELARPPLASLILGLLHYGVGWQVAEILFIILVSALFCYSAVKLADALKLNRLLFYALELSPFVLYNGTLVGTELLGLALLQLGLAYLILPASGLLLSLAVLARYNNIIYAPFVIFKKKNWFLRGLLYGIPILIWLAFNYFIYSSPFASVADSYAVNVVFREQVFSGVGTDILISLGWYLPFLLLGLMNLKKENWKTKWLIGIFAILTFISYIKIPLKESRYLFNMALPVAYLAAIGLRKYNSKKILAGIICANFLLATAAFAFFPFPPASLPTHSNIAQDLECACTSNDWIAFSSIGMMCEPLPRSKFFEKYAEEGYRIVIFKQGFSGDYNDSLIIEDASNYVILGNESICKEPLDSMNKTYLQTLPEIGINITYCEVLFGSLCSKQA